MTLEERVQSALSGSTDLTALVSTRISNTVAKQNCARPYLTFNIVGARVDYTHDGPVEFRDPEIQLDAWADTASTARNVIDTALDALVSDESPTDFYCFIEDDGTALYEPDTQIHRMMARVKTWWRP